MSHREDTVTCYEKSWVYSIGHLVKTLDDIDSLLIGAVCYEGFMHCVVQIMLESALRAAIITIILGTATPWTDSSVHLAVSQLQHCTIGSAEVSAMCGRRL